MKIAIIGAGAAGCFFAANLPYQNNVEVVIFEKSARAMQKVKVSGGGRCNVTHAHFDAETMANNYPRGKQLLRKSLYKFGVQDTMSWFESRGVNLKTEDDGRVFPMSNDSQTIIECIWKEIQQNKVNIQFNKNLIKVEKHEGQYKLYFQDKASFVTDYLIIASGGYPKKEAYQWINHLPQKTNEPQPSLFTFNLSKKHEITSLMGISTDVILKINGTKFKEEAPLLITHWGFSGPAVLRCSAWAAQELAKLNYCFNIQINWVKINSEQELKLQIQSARQYEGKNLVVDKNVFRLPKRLWEYLTYKSEISNATKWGDLSAKHQNKLIQNLMFDTYSIEGKTTFKEEFVTCGGVVLSDISSQTMESKTNKNVFFIGEVLDVDGITGGFNFQNAWTSAWIAAESIIKG